MLDEGIVITVLVAGIIPAGIYMHSIGEVVLAVFYGILGIALILALVARTRYPYDALETLGTDFIQYRLEEIAQCLIRIRAISEVYSHRLVGKFDGDDARVLLDIFIGSENAPYRLQIAVVLVAYADVLRAYARWTYDDIESMSDGILDEWDIELLEKFLIARRAESRWVEMAAVEG